MSFSIGLAKSKKTFVKGNKGSPLLANNSS